MSRVVWKYPILRSNCFEVPIPEDGKIVLVGPDPETGMPTIWAEVPPEKFEVPKIGQLSAATFDRPKGRVFHVLETGEEIPDAALRHVGSYMDERAGRRTLVWHVYENINP